MCSQGAGHALVTRINQSKKKVEGRRERQAGEQRRRREDVVRRFRFLSLNTIFH